MIEFKPEELFEGVDDVEELKSLPEKYITQKVILGIDIYKYSQYPSIEQIYIPVLFESLYDATVFNLTDSEPFFFDKYKKKEDFKKNFISTGDGGFQIFDNPLEAVLFALYFQLNVKRFVSGSNKIEFRKKLHKIIDSIELRYVITSDSIYCYSSNFFGAGIINNARILSKDSLNRCLIDSNTMKWFTNNINSVENIMDIDIASLTLTQNFKQYNKNLTSQLLKNKGNFKSVDVLKIGSINAKNNSLDVYNLHIQAILDLETDKHDYKRFVITLGNLNTTGIQ